ncbi:hypothetical protein HY468_02445, partial [Candidatus Roizmanbacteria bacterium]|nr:hypothetical protein [Candidatus Roizmanbacteria bacterium]
MYERGHSIGFGETLSRMKRNVLGCMAIGLLGLVVTSAIPAYSDGQPGPLPYHTIQMADPTFEKQLARMLGESPVEQDYLPVCQTESTLLFVDDSAAGGTNDGSSWENAYTDLQTGLTYIQQHSVPDEQGETPSWEAWVAEGTYRPTQDGDREKSFPFGHCTKAYGGFTGNEAERHQRDPRAHETILTGEIGDPAQTEDNADIIISVAPFTTPETIIDGFTVRDAYSDRFLHGAVFMTLAGPVLQNNVFTHNTSLDGGVINLNGALPFIANSQFKDNTVQAV